MPTIIDGTDYSATDWTIVETYVAAEADAEIRKHLYCENVDAESINFSCYTHSVSVRWLG